ncbi:hypothetical protein J4E81_002842 [Alternaria sp. BMP 2799]|uniref:uncharacterized protein n=1 Tax=Alternaria conjuncta TaxID=181017 RepID=UPI0022202FFF|nr:uncharacterized protein J4E85_006551 [Alternaria conjuncta]KAI4702478.1 hypothetical protein J4E81_002842 [Alternaria sp. BMP 2799]KAI4926259.1 hypothetical protein J4E85_006551 [Alternaria conjuncta]
MAVAENQVEHVVSDPAADNGGCSPFSDPPVSPPTHVFEPSASESDSYDTAIQLPLKLPYVVGFTTTATRHQPPEPFGVRYETDCPLSLPWENRKSQSKAEYCALRHVCDDQSFEVVKTLKITAVIRTGQNRGAQLVVINDDMVAKIYDPLYYEDVNEYGGDEDVVYDAFSDYSREAAAFHQLQKSPAAREVTPAFYGTWTILVDTHIHNGGETQKRKRQVPLILMEYVRGATMRDIDARALPEQTRSCLLKKILDVDMVILHAGVDNSDFCSRNIMITSLPTQSAGDAAGGFSVKAIDFNIAIVRRHPKCHNYKMISEIDEERKAWLPKLSSPILRWFNSVQDFAWDDWCPSGDGEPELWLWEQYRDDERYIPIIWDPSNPDVRPEYVELGSGSETSVDSGLGLDMVVEKGEEGGKKSSVEVEDHSVSAVQVS